MSQLKAVRQEEFSLICGRISLFVLFRPSTDWMRLPTLGSAICLAQAPASSRNTLIDMPRIHTMTQSS